MNQIIDCVFAYQETFLKGNEEKIKRLNKQLKKYHLPITSNNDLRIFLAENAYECNISRLSGVITKPSIGIFTHYHIHGVLLLYSLFGSIGFLTENFRPTSTLLRLFCLLTKDVKSAQELLRYLGQEEHLDPYFFVEYLFYVQRILILNRNQFSGVRYDVAKKRYQKTYQNHDELLVGILNSFASRKITSKVLVLNLHSTFYDCVANQVSLTKVFVGNILHPLSRSGDQPSFYHTWYEKDDQQILIKNNRLTFNDFLLMQQ